MWIFALIFVVTIMMTLPICSMPSQLDKTQTPDSILPERKSKNRESNQINTTPCKSSQQDDFENFNMQLLECYEECTPDLHQMLFEKYWSNVQEIGYKMSLVLSPDFPHYIHEASQDLRHLLGFTDDELTNSSIRLLAGPATDLPQLSCLLSSALQDPDAVFSFPLVLYRKDGSPFAVTAFGRASSHDGWAACDLWIFLISCGNHQEVCAATDINATIRCDDQNNLLQAVQGQPQGGCVHIPRRIPTGDSAAIHRHPTVTNQHDQQLEHAANTADQSIVLQGAAQLHHDRNIRLDCHCAESQDGGASDGGGERRAWVGADAPHRIRAATAGFAAAMGFDVAALRGASLRLLAGPATDLAAVRGWLRARRSLSDGSSSGATSRGGGPDETVELVLYGRDGEAVRCCVGVGRSSVTVPSL
jgi:hypothetical protein